MPPLPVITDVTRVTFNWNREANIQPVNVLHFRGLPDTEADLQTFFDDVLLNEMFACMPTVAIMDSVTLLPLDGTSASRVIPLLTGNHGQSSGDIVPALCAVASHRTDQRGPQGRGRTYVGPVTETANVSGVLDSTIAANMTAAWRLLQSRCALHTVDWVIASYVHSAAYVVTNSTVPRPLGTQRRRQNQLR